MKEKRTARLPHRAASTRRISASAPSPRSLGEGGFLTLCISLGVFVFFVALFARLAAGRPHHAELNSPASSHPIGIVIAGDGAEGASCQYIITPASDPIVPGTIDIGNHCADCGTLVTLPFPFVLYDQTFSAVTVSASGRLSFACNNEPGYSMIRCLPVSPDSCPYDFTIFPSWHDWYTGTDAVGCSRHSPALRSELRQLRGLAIRQHRVHSFS